MIATIFKYGTNDQNTIRFDYIVETHTDEAADDYRTRRQLRTRDANAGVHKGQEAESVGENEQAYLIVKMINSRVQLEGDDIERFFRQYNEWLKRG